MISKQILEDIGIEVPDDATRFFTEGNMLIFLLPDAEETGHQIVFMEKEVSVELNDEQIKALKEANCFGEKGWTIV